MTRGREPNTRGTTVRPRRSVPKCKPTSCVVAHAEANRFPLYRMLRFKNGVEPIPTSYDRRFCVGIPVGFRVCFTVQEHPGPVWCRHISVSVDGLAGAAPTRSASGSS